MIAWGSAFQGVLGLGDRSINGDQYEPVAVRGLPDDVVGVGAGHHHSLAVTAEGQLWTFGRNKEWQLGRPLGPDEQDFSSVPAPITSGSLGRHAVATATGSGVASFAVTTDGLLYAFGTSSRGQLGLGKDITRSREPQRVRLPGRVSHVAAGWGHAAAVLSDGRLFTWGWPQGGRLGHTFAASPAEEEESAVSSRCVWEPKEVELLQGMKVSELACGLDHTLALLQDGSLISFGDNSLGQLGRPARAKGEYAAPSDASALRVMPPSSLSGRSPGFKRIAAGLGHCLAVMTDGSVTSWGWNAAQQCGLGEQVDADMVHSPMHIYGIASNRDALLAAGRVHSVLVTDDVQYDSASRPRAFGRSWRCLTMCHT